MDLDKWVSRESLGQKAGKIVSSSGRAANVKKLYTEWLGTLAEDETPLAFGTFEKEVLLLLRSDSEYFEQDFAFQTCGTPDELVEQAVEFNGFHICPKGEQITQRGYNAGREDLENAVVHHLTHYKMDSKGPDGKLVREVWGVGELRVAMCVFLRDREVKTRDALRVDLAYNPGDVGFVDAVLDYFLRKFVCDGDKVLAREVIKQWLWQVKRYIHGLEVPDPLFINFFSEAQGIGKTFFIRTLTKSFKEFFKEGSLNEILDSREMEKWSSNYVILFDELDTGKMTPQEVGQTITALKALLTATDLTNREMRTTKHSTRKRTFSPISTSNDPITSVIYDPTGMRRFFELHFKVEKGHGPIQDIIDLDPYRIWLGIDHTLPRGYVYPGSEFGLKMAAVQDTYKRHDPLDWALEYVDYGEIPALRIDDGVEEILKQCEEGDKWPDLDGTPYILAHVPGVRKKYTDWLKDEMGEETARYVPQGDRFLLSLKSRGYATIVRADRKNGRRILCKKDNGGGGGGVGI